MATHNIPTSTSSKSTPPAIRVSPSRKKSEDKSDAAFKELRVISDESLEPGSKKQKITHAQQYFSDEADDYEGYESEPSAISGIFFYISVYFSYILIEQFGKQLEAYDESQQTHHEADSDSDLGDEPFTSTWLELANVVKRSAKIVNGSLINL